MKKIVFLFAVQLCVAQFTFAQKNEDFTEKLNFGLKAGVNLSNVYDEKGEEFRADSKLGFAVGAFVDIPVGKFIGFQPEVLLSQKGFQATGRILGSSYSFTRTTTFLDIPLLFAIKPVDFITILAGPQYSYLIKQKDVFTNAINTIEQETEFSNDNIRKNTLCFTGGVDVNISHLVLGARIGWDLLNNNGNGTSETPRYKNMWYQASIGFRL